MVQALTNFDDVWQALGYFHEDTKNVDEHIEPLHFDDKKWRLRNDVVNITDLLQLAFFFASRNSIFIGKMAEVGKSTSTTNMKLVTKSFLVVNVHLLAPTATFIFGVFCGGFQISYCFLLSHSVEINEFFFRYLEFYVKPFSSFTSLSKIDFT